MNALLKTVSLCFAAGAAGGLANAVFVWGMGAAGGSAMMGVSIAPAWTPPWLYNRLVWGGVWGLTLAVPLFTGSVVARGILFSLAPTGVQLLVVFPNMLHKGLYGLDLGQLTPVFVLAANAVWGIAAAWWLSRVQEGGRPRGLR